MRYYKHIENGYILAIGIGGGNVEITADEYAHIVDVVKNRPTPPNGKDYRLAESLEWEEYDKPVEEVAEDVGSQVTEEDY